MLSIHRTDRISPKEILDELSNKYILFYKLTKKRNDDKEPVVFYLNLGSTYCDEESSIIIF